MLRLVQKRHEGDGWLVFSELANKPGGHDRYADAFALGVWASTKYEAHLYEFKQSRTDLRRELKDPTKAEGVGKYATYWWLAVEDEKILDGLVIPEAWGIVTPQVRGGHRMFKVVRKAPRLKPAPFSPMFAVSMIRNMAKRWVAPGVHAAVKEQLADVLANRDIKPAPDVVELEMKIAALESQLKDLIAGLDEFHARSGVDLRDLRRYEMGAIGDAVKVVSEHRRLATGDVSSFVRTLSETAHTLEDRARQAAESAVALRALMPRTACADSCSMGRGWSGRCTCGAQPLSEVERKIARDALIADACADPAAADKAGLEQATSAHDKRGGVDRGGAGAPIQDAGLLLRHLGDEVPHG